MLTALLFCVPVFARAETPAATSLESSFRASLASPYSLDVSAAPYAGYTTWFPGSTFSALRSHTANFYSLNAASVQRGAVFGSDASDLGFAPPAGPLGANALRIFYGSILAGDSIVGPVTSTLTVGFVRPGALRTTSGFAPTTKAGFHVVTTGAYTVTLFTESGERLGAVDGNGTGFLGLTTWQPFAFAVLEFRNPISSGLAGIEYSVEGSEGSVALLPPTPPVTYPGTQPQSGAVLGATTSAPAFIVAQGSGGRPEVRLVSADGSIMTRFLAYGEGYRGGVQVAMGDLDGDGVTEIVTAPGKRSSPHVRIFRLDGTYVGGFFAYDRKFRGGVNIAVADIDHDGSAEIVTAPKRGGGPQVRVVRWKGRVARDAVQPFYAYSKKFRGGVRVALGDVDGNGATEIVTAPETGDRRVRTFSTDAWSVRPAQLGFAVRGTAFRDGMTLAVGDLDGDDRDEVVVGSLDPTLQRPAVFSFRPNAHAMRRRDLSFPDGGIMPGAHFAVVDLDDNGRGELVIAAGQGQEPVVQVRTLDGTTVRIEQTFRVFRGALVGGMSVARGFLE